MFRVSDNSPWSNWKDNFLEIFWQCPHVEARNSTSVHAQFCSCSLPLKKSKVVVCSNKCAPSYIINVRWESRVHILNPSDSANWWLNKSMTLFSALLPFLCKWTSLPCQYQTFLEQKCKSDVSSHKMFWYKLSLRSNFEAKIKHWKQHYFVNLKYEKNKTLLQMLTWSVSFRNSLITQPCCCWTCQQSGIVKAAADRVTQAVLQMSIWINSQQHSIALVLTEGHKWFDCEAWVVWLYKGQKYKGRERECVTLPDTNRKTKALMKCMKETENATKKQHLLSIHWGCWLFFDKSLLSW